MYPSGRRCPDLVECLSQDSSRSEYRIEHTRLYKRAEVAAQTAVVASGRNRSGEVHPPHVVHSLIHGARMDPPQQSRGEVHAPQSRGQEQQPDVHLADEECPAVLYWDLNHFKHNVPLTDHWRQHDRALQYISDVARRSGEYSHRLPIFGNQLVEKPTVKHCTIYQFDHGPGDESITAQVHWSWHELVAQLDDESMRKVVEGSAVAGRPPSSQGLVACMVRESGREDKRKRPADGHVRGRKELLYHWEFVLLRTDGTTAYLRPQVNTTIVEYYHTYDLK